MVSHANIKVSAFMNILGGKQLCSGRSHFFRLSALTEVFILSIHNHLRLLNVKFMMTLTISYQAKHHV